MLRDILVKMLAKQLGTDEGKIIDDLLAKREPDNGTLQQILDEVRNLQEISRSERTGSAFFDRSMSSSDGTPIQGRTSG